MGLRGRLQEKALQAGAEALRRTANSVPAQVAEDGLRGFRGMLAGREESLSVEFFLLSLVRAVRSDGPGEDHSQRDVYVLARKRRRRLALASLTLGPFSGLANQLADLYCEAAIVCHLADLQGKDLTDDQVAAHMLVLWNVADDLEAALSAVAGDPPVADLLGGRVFSGVGERLPEAPTKSAIVKALWGVRGDMPKVRKAGPGETVQTAAFAGFQAKGVIKRIEAQLGFVS